MDLEDRIEAKLDFALEMTFPASDAFSISIKAAQQGGEEKTAFRAKARGSRGNSHAPANKLLVKRKTENDVYQ